MDEKSLQIEQIKIQITNQSQHKDFLKSLRKSKTNVKDNNNILTTMTTRDLEKSTISINTSRMNTSFMDDFSHGFNTFWNRLLTKFNARAKNNNILDSISSIENPPKK